MKTAFTAFALFALIALGAALVGENARRTHLTVRTIVDEEQVLATLARKRRKEPSTGVIRDAGRGRLSLVVDGRVVFAGFKLSDVTVATDGALALLCRTSAAMPIEKADLKTNDPSEVLEGSIGQVWVVTPDGAHRRQVSPKNMSASGPLISPDGRLVSFAGVILGDRNLPHAGIGLFVWHAQLDRLITTIVVRDTQGYMYPLEWTAQGDELWVYVDEGERNGGAVRLELIRPRFDP